ncbi:MAG: hypothetical protein SVN78_05315 [Deferribacterota bacterium]|nr:hypothetical protein [Deferribacterota bacterium]
MGALDQVKREKIIDVLEKADKEKLSSFSFKILLGQLRVKLEISKSKEDVVDECVQKLNEYVDKYGSLKSVKDDIYNLFNIRI